MNCSRVQSRVTVPRISMKNNIASIHSYCTILHLKDPWYKILSTKSLEYVDIEVDIKLNVSDIHGGCWE